MNHKERTHSELGGSSIGTALKCPGSVFLKKELPELEPNDAAKKGTLAHEICEVVLSGYLNYKVTGDTPALHAHTLTDDDEL